MLLLDMQVALSSDPQDTVSPTRLMRAGNTRSAERVRRLHSPFHYVLKVCGAMAALCVQAWAHSASLVEVAAHGLKGGGLCDGW